MKIAIIGYGKMGKAIETIALERKHEVVLKVDVTNIEEFNTLNLQKADVAIEFSTPGTAFNNYLKCFEANIPTVSGSTGWLDKINEIKKICNTQEKGFFYASNFSIGVHVFFQLNKYLARIMNNRPNYNISIEETHHIHKLDAPSGTAITLAEGIIEKINKQTNWELVQENKKSNNIPITAIREGKVPGRHIVKYSSEIDTIEIQHNANSRKGFALGAVLAAEFMNKKTGFYGMEDLLNFANIF